MNIYLAGKWTDKEKLKICMNNIENIGHKITHDWTTFEADPNNSKRSMADHDIQGVITADAYISYMSDNEYAYRGTFTELGVALSIQRMNANYKIYIVCPSYFNDKSAYCITNCFFHSSGIKYVPDWETMMDILDKLKQNE